MILSKQEFRNLLDDGYIDLRPIDTCYYIGKKYSIVVNENEVILKEI